MNNNQNKAIYQAKHAFNGNSSQSQLSFNAGARIIAAQNQLGQWWWGNCNGQVSFMLCLFLDIMSCLCSVLGKGGICVGVYVCMVGLSIRLNHILLGAY